MAAVLLVALALVAVSVCLVAVGLADLADRLSRYYRGRPVRWRDLWTDVDADRKNGRGSHGN